MSKWWNYLKTWFIVTRKRILRLLDQSKGEDYTKFAIICAPRSGSTMLHTYLNSHPAILSHGEIIRIKLEQGVKEVSTREYIFMPISKRIKAVGVKLFYEYEGKEGYDLPFREVLSDESIKVIHLIRKDLRKQYESLKRARDSGVWSSTLKPKEQQPIEIPEEEYKQHEQMQTMVIKSITDRLRGHDIFETTYEELTDDPKNVLNKVQKFLGVEPRPLYTLLQKQS